jgi:RimJ/RimL family protein N-acetyltransferase
VRAEPTRQIIVDDELLLEPASPNHLEELVGIFEDEVAEVRMALPWILSEEPLRPQMIPFLTDMQYYGEHGIMHNWMVRDRNTLIIVGMIGLDDSTHAVGADWNLGYWVRRIARGRTVATRMMDSVISFAKNIDCHALELKVSPANLAGVATVRSALRRWGGERAEAADRDFEVEGKMVLHNSYLLRLQEGQT